VRNTVGRGVGPLNKPWVPGRAPGGKHKVSKRARQGTEPAGVVRKSWKGRSVGW